jgi:hypothetical protein
VNNSLRLKRYPMKFFSEASYVESKIGFTIKVAPIGSNTDKKSSKDIKDLLISKLNSEDFHFHSYYAHGSNEIEIFIKSMFAWESRKWDNTTIIVSDYREKEGSFIFDFIVNVVASISAYAGLRQGLEYILNDIVSIFHQVLGNNFEINRAIVEREFRKINPNINISERIYNLGKLTLKGLYHGLLIALCIWVAFYTMDKLKEKTESPPKVIESVVNPK